MWCWWREIGETALILAMVGIMPWKTLKYRGGEKNGGNFNNSEVEGQGECGGLQEREEQHYEDRPVELRCLGRGGGAALRLLWWTMINGVVGQGGAV